MIRQMKNADLANPTPCSIPSHAQSPTPRWMMNPSQRKSVRLSPILKLGFTNTGVRELRT